MNTYTAMIRSGVTDEMTCMIEQERPCLGKDFLDAVVAQMLFDLQHHKIEFQFCHIFRDGEPVAALSVDTHTEFWPAVKRLAIVTISRYRKSGMRTGFADWQRLREIHITK